MMGNVVLAEEAELQWCRKVESQRRELGIGLAAFREEQTEVSLLVTWEE